MSIVYYISGHGCGHAVRSAEVIRQLSQLTTGYPIFVRTSAPSFLFGRIAAGRVSNPLMELDAGPVEHDIFKIDATATVDRLVHVCANKYTIIQTESDWLRKLKPKVIVADIPWLAGDIAEQCNVPCVGISNFLWNWIYDPFVKDHAQGGALTSSIQESYNRLHCILRLPLSHEIQLRIPVTEVPFVADHGRMDSAEIFRRTGLNHSDSRVRVLVSLRDVTSLNALAEVAIRQPEFTFVVVGKSEDESIPNVRYVSIDESVTLADLVAWSQIVLAKPGYGMMSTCAVNRARFLCIPRTGFREDEVLLAQGKKCFPIRVMPLEDFREGKWEHHMAALINAPFPDKCIEGNGAQICAENISKLL